MGPGLVGINIQAHTIALAELLNDYSVQAVIHGALNIRDRSNQVYMHFGSQSCKLLTKLEPCVSLGVDRVVDCLFFLVAAVVELLPIHESAVRHR